MLGVYPALLGIPGVELCGIMRVMCETVENKTIGRKFDMQTRHLAVRIVEQTGTYRQSQMKTAQVQTNPPSMIILIPLCQIILIPVTAKKQTKE